MTKILVTGATGYLAGTLIPIIQNRTEVVGLARDPSHLNETIETVAVDVRNKAELVDTLSGIKPDAVIHCAACNPGGSDEDMVSINEQGSVNVAEAAARLGCRLVSVSSDTVLDGDNAPYPDDAVAVPKSGNAYAISKANAENHVLSLVPDAIVVRTSLIYGVDQMDRGTTGFVNRLASGQPLKLFTDVIRQPVLDKALSQSLLDLALVHTRESGIMNVAGDEAMSRYAFAMAMMDYWNVQHDGEIIQTLGAGIQGLPLDCRLKLDRAHSLGFKTPGVSEVLRQQ